MRSISRFTVGLGLVMAGMFAVGVGVAQAQVGNTKADACLLRLPTATINLEHIVYITQDSGRGPDSIRLWYAGGNGAYVRVGSSDLTLYTTRLRNCVNAK